MTRNPSRKQTPARKRSREGGVSRETADSEARQEPDADATKLAVVGRSVLRGILLLCLLFAVFLRCRDLGWVEFKGDELKAIELAFSNVHHSVALVGLRSSNVLYNPPFFVYLMSIPVAFSTSPVFVTGFVVALNLLGLAILFRFLWRTYGLDFALLAGALFASSPWSIIFSRKIWAQDCLFPFLVLTYVLLTSSVERYRPWKLWALAALVAVSSQLHMSAWFLPLPLALFWLVHRLPLRPRDLAIGAGVGIVSYAPYLWFHAQTKLANLHEFLAFRRTRHDGELSLANLANSFHVATGTKLEFLLGRKGYEHLQAAMFGGALEGIFTGYMALAMLAVAVLVWHLLKTARRPSGSSEEGGPQRALVVAGILVYAVVQVCYALLHIEPHLHYSIIFYPLIAIFCVYVIEYVVRWQAIRRVCRVTVLLVIASHLYCAYQFQNVVRSAPESISGDYGIPYELVRGRWQKLLDRTLQVERGRP